MGKKTISRLAIWGVTGWVPDANIGVGGTFLSVFFWRPEAVCFYFPFSGGWDGVGETGRRGKREADLKETKSQYLQRNRCIGYSKQMNTRENPREQKGISISNERQN